jgi:hypothetical protein
MTTPTLIVLPTLAAYSTKPANNIIEIKLDGGLSRRRLDQLNAARTVNVQWILQATDYQYFMTFYKTTISNGALPFYLDLKIDDNSMTQCLCYFMADSLSIEAITHNTFKINASLEVLA